MAATIQATAEGTIFGITRRDAPAPAHSGEVAAAVRFFEGRGVTFFDSCRALAGQTDNGVAACLAEGFNELVAKADNTLEARTSWDSVVTNTSSRSLHYVYQFRIKGIELALRDLGMVTDLTPFAPFAEYGVEIKLNGNILFESHGALLGGAGAHVLQETGTDLGGSLFTLGTQFGYRYPIFDGALSLGFLDPGEDLHVQATLVARTRTRLAFTGAKATIGDPLDMKGDPGIDSAIVPDETIGVETSTFGRVKALFR
jgi:hypothetical protein